MNKNIKIGTITFKLREEQILSGVLKMILDMILTH